MTGGGSHGAGSKRPARTDASALFKRGGPKAMRPAHRPGDAAGRAGRGGPDEAGDDRRDDGWGARRRRRRRRRAEGARSNPPATDRSRRTRGSPPSSGRCAPRSSAPRGRTRTTSASRVGPPPATPHSRSSPSCCGRGASTSRSSDTSAARRRTCSGGGALPGGDGEAGGGAAGTRAEDERRRRKRKRRSAAGAAMSLRAVRDAVTRRCGVREAWYAVFAKLAREGYTVRRFDSPWCQPTRGFRGRRRRPRGVCGVGAVSRRLSTANVLAATETEPTVEKTRKEDESTAAADPAANGWWVDASTWTGAPADRIVPEPPERRLQIRSRRFRSRCSRCTLPTGTSANGTRTTWRSSCSTGTGRRHRTRCGRRRRRRRTGSARAGPLARKTREEDRHAGGPYAIPGEKMVYAHVSDSTVMMYRMAPSRAPESDEVPQSL